MKKTIILSAAVLAFCILHTACSFSQGTAINSTGAKADSSAILDVSSTNKGVRIPRVALTDTALAAPVSNPVHSLLVFDTVTFTNGTPGYYYWDAYQTQWVKLATVSGSSSSSCAELPVVPSNNVIICLDSTLNLTASSPLPSPVYTWMGPANFFYSSTDPNITITSMQQENTGIYFVTVSSGGLTSPPALVNVDFPATQHGSQNFSYTGSDQIYVVPPCVTSVTAKIWGAGGGGSSANYGGTGGYTTGTIAVLPGDTLIIKAGQGGTTSCGGTCTNYGGGGKGQGTYGGGGGYSAVFKTTSPLLIAGAGGGGASSDCGGGGNCGGGGTNGNNGYGWISGDNEYGRGGTQAAGGNGGSCYPGEGSAGAGGYLTGGNGTYGSYGGGGGGGGGYKGGGGGCYGGTRHGGGGGGCGYIGGAGVSGASTTTGPNSGDPNYVSGTCVGGTAGNNGGNGNVYISW